MSAPTDRRPYAPPREVVPEGSFERQPYVFRDWLSADGSTGYKAEAGRYHLYVSWACPWAQRAAIVRRLLGLDGVIGLGVVDPIRDERGWAFTDEPDPVNDFAFLREAYLATDPSYDLRPTVPVLWDRERARIVTNNFHDIPVMFATEFGALAASPLDLYPMAMREEIDTLNEQMYLDVNDGVYRCGFAASQAAYDHAVSALFARLEELDRRLADRRFLFGQAICLSDVYLFTTLVRFDAVYHTHFKCNVRRLVDYEYLWPYARDLYQHDAFGGTTDMDHIERHYYLTHENLNPSGIVPAGPEVDWKAPHERERIS